MKIILAVWQCGNHLKANKNNLSNKLSPEKEGVDLKNIYRLISRFNEWLK